jgi:hypothetical protein
LVDDQERLAHWVSRVARNAVIDEYRRAARARRQWPGRTTPSFPAGVIRHTASWASSRPAAARSRSLAPIARARVPAERARSRSRVRTAPGRPVPAGRDERQAASATGEPCGYPQVRRPAAHHSAITFLWPTRAGACGARQTYEHRPAFRRTVNGSGHYPMSAIRIARPIGAGASTVSQ